MHLDPLPRQSCGLIVQLMYVDVMEESDTPIHDDSEGDLNEDTKEDTQDELGKTNIILVTFMLL